MRFVSSSVSPRRFVGIAAALLTVSACVPGIASRRAPAPAAEPTATPAPAGATTDGRSAGAAPASTRTVADSEWQGRSAKQVEDLLVGRFAGVHVQRTGGGLSVRIRGAGGFITSGEPLFVVDGMPVDAGPDGLVMFNPSDVASIEILTDPSSLALWGSRGANGVVLIRTRQAYDP